MSTVVITEVVGTTFRNMNFFDTINPTTYNFYLIRSRTDRTKVRLLGYFNGITSESDIIFAGSPRPETFEITDARGLERYGVLGFVQLTPKSRPTTKDEWDQLKAQILLEIGATEERPSAVSSPRTPRSPGAPRTNTPRSPSSSGKKAKGSSGKKAKGGSTKKNRRMPLRRY
jgi:hypothetical protein